MEDLSQVSFNTPLARRAALVAAVAAVAAASVDLARLTDAGLVAAILAAAAGLGVAACLAFAIWARRQGQ
jgi:hypothetical protein